MATPASDTSESSPSADAAALPHARAVLLPRRARPFYGHHPWVYAGAVARIEGDPADGDVIDLVSHTDNFVARGLYNSRSKIRRICSAAAPGCS